jgi:putative mRNA 3-end processing factor
MKYKIKISHRGAIQLGKLITCDGFLDNDGYRVQTHIHEDHLVDFSTSLGYQKGVILTQPSLELVSSIKNEPALSYRRNVHIVKGGELRKFDNFKIKLLDSTHMLGSVQVGVYYNNGFNCGYSGDFSWPLDEVIQVDVLVIDSTYGSPDSVRKITQEKVEEYLLDLVIDHYHEAPLIIIAKRGTLERAMHCIRCNIDLPFIVSKKLEKEIEIFNKYGYGIENYFITSSNEGKDILKSKRYIRFFGSGDILPGFTEDYIIINLKGIFGRLHPIIDHGNKSFTVAYSNHADFNETLNYIKASNAKIVVTDPTRAGFKNANKLAKEIQKKLNIKAYPYEVVKSNYWGE